MEEILNRHEKIVLMFSGGKDSIACLYLLKPFLDKITVLWVNPGDLFPENEKIITAFREWIPNFMEVKSDALAFKEKYGLPTDILAIHDSQIGEISEGKKDLKVINGYDCCSNNYWQPAARAIKELRATLIIRGQRNDESATSPIRSGHIEDGVEYLFPIELWNHAEVLSYIKEQGFISPEFFQFAESSLDCLHCTAFLEGTADRREYMKKHHPEAYRENKQNIELILASVEKSLARARDIL